MVTIYDIAKKANVSTMTVSRVINNTGSIKESTKQKIESAIKELGYIPNTAARSLTSKKTKLLSLIVSDITNPFFTKVTRGAEDKALEMGYQLLLSNSDEDIKKESIYIDMILSTRVDGVLITPTGDQSIKELNKLRDHDIPIVLLDRDIANFKCDQVIGDSYNGSRKLMEHLIEWGHKKIALINGPSTISTARERQRGYLEAIQLAGLRIHHDYISQINFKIDNAMKVVQKLLSLPKHEQPTAIFAANNFIAISTIKALHSFGWHVPKDIAVVSFDDIEPIESFNPFLTVASQPAYQFGQKGIKLLIDRINGRIEGESKTTVLTPEIRIRESSKKALS